MYRIKMFHENKIQFDCYEYSFPFAFVQIDKQANRCESKPEKNENEKEKNFYSPALCHSDAGDDGREPLHLCM